MSEPMTSLSYWRSQSHEELEREVYRLEGETARLRAALDLVMWMAEKYAEGGGSNGPEMLDFQEAEALAAQQTTSQVGGESDQAGGWR